MSHIGFFVPGHRTWKTSVSGPETWSRAYTDLRNGSKLIWVIQYKTLLILKMHHNEGRTHSTNSNVLRFSPWQLWEHTINVQQHLQGHRTRKHQASMPGSFSRTLTLPSSTLDRKLLCGRNKYDLGRGGKKQETVAGGPSPNKLLCKNCFVPVSHGDEWFNFLECTETWVGTVRAIELSLFFFCN